MSSRNTPWRNHKGKAQSEVREQSPEDREKSKNAGGPSRSLGVSNTTQLLSMPNHGRALYFSYSSVWRLVKGTSCPLISRCFICVLISSGSPSVTMIFAIFPDSIDPILSDTPKISAG